MEKDEKLKLLKLRVLRSYRWNKDIVTPLSQEFNISSEEFEDILMKHLDMSDLENLHATFEIANRDNLMRQLHVDLRLYLFCDILDFVSKEQSYEIESDLAHEIIRGKDYDEVLNEGRMRILELIR